MAQDRTRKNPSKAGPFYNELYWFVTIGLLACLVGLLILPPRASESISLLQKEQRLHRELEDKKHEVEVYKKAIESVENDPVYREGVFRDRLGVKKAQEVFLDPPPKRTR